MNPTKKITSVWLGALLFLLPLAETTLASNTLPKALITTPGELNRFKPGVVVPFNGSESYDPDGGAITFYKWYVDGVLESSGGSSSYSMFHRSFTLASGERYRSVTITLEVRDDELSWSSVSRTFTITEVTTYYYVTDHVGSVRSIVDDGGFEVSYEDFDPFGAPLPGRSHDSGLAYQQNKFTGHELDDEAGLDIYYMITRGYDPVLGRFMQIDPHYDKYPDLSSYAYVGNNPLVYVDSTGMDSTLYIRQTYASVNLNQDQKDAISQQAKSVFSQNGVPITVKFVSLDDQGKMQYVKLDPTDVRIDIFDDSNPVLKNGKKNGTVSQGAEGVTPVGSQEVLVTVNALTRNGVNETGLGNIVVLEGLHAMGLRHVNKSPNIMNAQQSGA